MPTPAEQLVAQITPRQLSTAPFDRWTYADAVAAVKARMPEDYEVRKQYVVNHNHLQSGTQWVGPGDATSNDKIQQQFAPDDVIGEALSNIENAFREPQIGFTPIEPVPPGQQIPAETQALIDEATTLLSEWWDKRNLHELITSRIWASGWAGWAALRLWIAQRFIVENNGSYKIRDARDFRQAFRYIFVDAPEPASCALVKHINTQDVCAVYFDIEHVERGGRRQELKRVELVFLDPAREDDEDAETFIRIVYEDPVKNPEISTSLRLGGNLTVAEMTTRPLITPPVIRSQQQLNFICTILTRMSELAAFRERYFKNSKPQGRRIPYEEGDTLSDGAFLERDEEGVPWQVIPVERTIGPNITTELVGLPRQNDKGDFIGHEDVDVLVVDPVDPTPYIEAAESVRRRTLRMCRQGHLAGTSNFEVSGIAYEQARAVFAKDLNKRRVAEEGMLREFILQLFLLAEYIADRPGYFTKVIRPVVDQHVDPGPRSPDTIRLDHEAYEKGLISKPTAMSRINVEDIVSEELQLTRSVEMILRLLEKLPEPPALEGILNALRLAGVPGDVINALNVPREDDPSPPADGRPGSSGGEGSA